CFVYGKKCCFSEKSIHTFFNAQQKNREFFSAFLVIF
ncbi:DNA polymerase III subunit chi, partial [Enterococcus faecalis]